MKQFNSFEDFYINRLPFVSNVSIESLDILRFIVPFHPCSYIEVPDAYFLKVFNLLYVSNINNFCIMTNFNSRGPAGFSSRVDRAKKAFYNNIYDDDKIILINSSCLSLNKYTFFKEKQIMSVGSLSTYDSVVEGLESSFFKRVPTVVDVGTFALRGFVVDLYPPGLCFPVRIDFSHKENCLYSFEVNSQTTIKEISSVNVLVNDSASYVDSISNYLDNYTRLYFSGTSLQINELYKKTLNINKTTTYSGSSFIKDSSLESYGLAVDGLVFAPSLGQHRVEPFYKNNVVSPESTGFENISLGQLVVHDIFGVGVYAGITANDESVDAGVLVEFSDGRIVVNISNLDVLSVIPLTGPQPGVSSISKKGVWRRKRSLIKKRISSFVDSILNQHLQRSKTIKKRSFVDINMLNDFLSAFSFDDTVDQASSWKNICLDLASPAPMDRLLCGDVGFGKTEIAIRSAFYSILGGGRVVVIAPTTVLCHQLYLSFSSRLEPFSVTCGMISRMQTKKVCTNLIDSFNSNRVDLLICTHRILSHLDVLDNVDLVIIDEEHRFGVQQKQSFLDRFNNIDILSMSATPIPRSMQKALSGIKTISTISTPPIDRLPIETVVEYYNEDAIIEYVSNEVGRGGQVYVLHNDIKSIPVLRKIISVNLPSISCEYIHGKMSTKEVEKTIDAFIEKKFEVLLSTTIIENGIDIQNVNTIIINNAHMFGLAQLHQIRGRVGRSAVQSYAYLMIPKELKLNRGSFERLKAVEKNNSLGSGYYLSMRDLELRGAGSLFGYAQSGGATYGFDLYNKILKKVLKTKGGKGVTIEDVSVDVFGFSAYIPKTYIKEDGLRVDLYKKITIIDSETNLIRLFENIKNRYGAYSKPLKLLFKNQVLKILAYRFLFVSILRKNSSVEVVLLPSKYIKDTPFLIRFVGDFCKDLSVAFSFRSVSENRLSIIFVFKNPTNKDIYMFLFDFLNKFKSIFYRNKK